MENEPASNQIKNSHLNSLMFYDPNKRQHQCLAPQISPSTKPRKIDSNKLYQPYVHDESDENISTWNVQPNTIKKSGSWFSFFPFYDYVQGKKIGGLTYLVTSFSAVFCFGLYMVHRFCLRKLQNRQVGQSEIRAARRAAMHISYESSDGYSGSEMEFDDSRSMSGNSTYSAGDVNISFDDGNGVIDWTDDVFWVQMA